VAKYVRAKAEWAKCERCGERFVLALYHDERRYTEGATKRIYCGPTCRVMAYRERKAAKK